MTVVLVAVMAVWVQVPAERYSLPAVPMKSKVTTLHHGVWPGSAVLDNSKSSETFQRVEYIPTRLRLFVRANCEKTISDSELIERAKEITGQSSGVTQIDWGRVDADGEITFYGVYYTLVRKTDVNLRASDGRYLIENHQIRDQEKWQVSRVRIRALGGGCYAADQVNQHDLRVAIFNTLNLLSGQAKRERNFN